MPHLDPATVAWGESAQPLPAKKSPAVPRHRPGEAFLKGPIPWRWLAAALLPGRCLHVGLVLWHLHWLQRRPKIRLNNATLLELGVDKHAKRRALKRLEEAGLIAIERRTGNYPLITLLDLHDSQGDPG